LSDGEQVGQVKGAGSRRRISISTILWLLVAAIVIPELVFSAVTFQRNNEAQQTMLTTLAEATAGSIAESVDRQISGMVATLKVLSTSRAIETGDLAGFYSRVSKALHNSGTYLALADSSLGQIMNTRAPLGAPLNDVTDKVTAERALSTGEPAVTGVFFGRTAQRWVFNVMLPVEENSGGARLLILSQNVEALAGALAARNLRGGWNAVIVDRQGTVIASSFSWEDVGKPFFLFGGEQATAGITVPVTVEYDGQTYETIRARSEMTGWQTIVWSPTAVVRAPVINAMRMLALGGLAVIAIGVVLAWVLGRRITGSVKRLATDARRLGVGDHVDEGDYPIAEFATVSQALAQASKERQAAENEIRFLMREVAHRSKNQLTVVSSIAKQTARHARSFAAFQDSFQKRIQGLARSTDLLIAGGVAGVELKALVEAQIEPFRPNDPGRLKISGTAFRLSNQAAQTLGLALHELSTNAAKYGAFAWPDGRLEIAWKRSGDRLVFHWREYVSRVRRRGDTRGFGTEVIERMLGGALEAEIERTLHNDGLECRVSMPLERLRPEVDAAAGSPQSD
jgi:two-component sensor histidine kinase